jgi:hypothetical protein
LLPFPDDIRKEIEGVIYEFLWNSKTHKVKRAVMIQDYKYGGHKMIDLRTLNMTQKLKWIKLYLNCHDCQWRTLIEASIKVKNLNIYLRNNYDLDINTTKSLFYREVLQILYKLNAVDESFKITCIKNQFIHYNKNIKIGGKIIYDRELFQAGMWRCSDLYDSNGNIMPFHVWKSRGVQPSKYLIWRGIVSVVSNININMLNAGVTNNNKCIVLPTSDIVDIQMSSSKELYSKILQLRKEEPTALKTYIEHFSLNEQEIENMYVIPRMCTNDMVIKELQFKILHKYLPTNALLYKMKKVGSQKCTFCNIYNETILHIFYDCIEIRNLWHSITNRLEQIDSTVTNLNRKDVILGYDLENTSPSALFVNNIVLHAKAFLWKCKTYHLLPSYNKFVEYIRHKKSLEPLLEVFFPTSDIS